MSIRLAVSYAAAGALAVCFATAVSGEAKAQANVLKECGSQYQAAKAANELKGQSWQDFLKACRARIAEPKTEEAPPAVAAPTPAPRADDGCARKSLEADNSAACGDRPCARRKVCGSRQACQRRSGGHARPPKEMRRGMEGAEGGIEEKGSESEMAEILERVQ